MLRSVIVSAALLAGLGIATPALAAPNCHALGNGPIVGFQIHVGEPFTEDDQNNFDLMNLRRMGVDATRVERWGGCIRAFVRNHNGRGEHMEFFNAQTLEPVY